MTHRRAGVDLRQPAPRGVRLVALALLRDARDAAREYTRAADRRSDHLHAFRLAVRRLRSWMMLWREELSESVSRRHERRMRRITRATNGARDIDALREWLRKQGRGARRPHARPVKALRADLKRERKHARSDARDAAESLDAHYRRLRRRLTAHALREGNGEDIPFGSALASTIRAASTELEAALEAIRTVDDHDAIHAARIAAKRLRYLLEPVAPSVRGSRVVIATLQVLQDLSGTLHDAWIFEREILQHDLDEPAQRYLTRTLRKQSASDFATLGRQWLHDESGAFFMRVERLAERITA